MSKTTSILAGVVSLTIMVTSGQMHLPVATVRSQATTALASSFGWAKSWGGDQAIADRVVVDEAGNLYVAGYFTGGVDFDPDANQTDWHTSANGSIDASLSKFGPNGNLVWAKTWGGGSGRDVAYGVDVDSAGNVYVVGAYRYTVDFNPDPILSTSYTSNYPGENNIYLSKFAPDGTFQWVRTWGPAAVPGKASFGGEAYSVVVEGNALYVVGDFSGDRTDFNPWGIHDWHANTMPISGNIVWFNAFLSKFDRDGNFQWAKTWGGEGYDDGPGVAVDGAGSIYVAGMYASQNINFDPDGGSEGLGHPAHDSGSVVDIFLSKFDSNGDFQWVKTWGGQGTEEATGLVTVDGLNNVYVAGRFACVGCNFNPDPNATPDIHSTHNPAPPNAPWQQQDEALDIFLTKLTVDGTFQWTQTWGGNGHDSAMGLAVDQAGNVHVSGEFSSTVDFDPGSAAQSYTAHGQKDAFLSQFDTSGTFNWAHTWGGSGNDNAMGLALDEAGNLYPAGGFVGSVDLNPGSGTDMHNTSSRGGAFLSKFVRLTHATYIPLVAR